MEAVLDYIPISFPWSIVLLVAPILMTGIVVAYLSGLFNDFVDLVFNLRTMNLALLGIAISFVAVDHVRKNLNRILNEMRECFDVEDRTYEDFVRELLGCWRNSRGHVVGISIAIVSLLGLAVASYPRPIFRQSLDYLAFDWYELILFMFVMIILGSVCWVAASALWRTRRLGTMPIFLERIRDLEPFVRTFLLYVAAWFVCTALVYLALPLPYAIVAILIGYLAFLIPQVQLHNGIVLKKRATLAVLFEKYAVLLERFTGPEGESAFREFDRSLQLSSLSTLIRNIEDTREWPIRHSQLFNLVLSSFTPIIVRYAVTGSL